MEAGGQRIWTVIGRDIGRLEVIDANNLFGQAEVASGHVAVAFAGALALQSSPLERNDDGGGVVVV